MTARPSIVWFKRDLRTADHRPLAAALERGPVIPLFVVEPDLWRQPDLSGRQWVFVMESLTELREDLAALGQPLIVRVGAVTDILAELYRTHGVSGLFSHEETGNDWTFARDLRVASWCRDHGIPWYEERQTGVIRRLRDRDGWARRWDRFMSEPEIPPAPALPSIPGLEPGPIPTAADLDLVPDACPSRQEGGRTAGRQCLQSFLHERGAGYRKAMSSPVTAFERCSRLSPHLAWGTLAMRETAIAVRSRRADLRTGARRKGATQADLSSLAGRLHWHCHFMQKLESDPTLEFHNLHSAYEGLRPRAPDTAKLSAWASGETGLPFVDACMRALRATGWMNFRMRAMLVSFATHHLWLDWRPAGLALARLFTDYEPGIHWPQMQMQAGTTGINTVRIYNPVKQGLEQDPDGRFVRRWVPELAPVPDAHIHQPWNWDGAGALLGRTYPAPIVDHTAAAREARQKIWSVRKGPAYRAEADRIQSKHGSRRSGMPMTGSKPDRRRKETAQLSLSLPDGD